MDNIAKEYNSSQLEAIKDVCVSRNGICLLQGPVIFVENILVKEFMILAWDWQDTRINWHRFRNISFSEGFSWKSSKIYHGRITT